MSEIYVVIGVDVTHFYPSGACEVHYAGTDFEKAAEAYKQNKDESDWEVRIEVWENGQLKRDLIGAPAKIEFFEGYGSAEGREPLQTTEIPFTYEQVVDEQYAGQVNEAVRKQINADFKGHAFIFFPDGRRVVGFRF